MNPETRLQHEIMLALSEAGCIVFRNNTGQAWLGKPIHQAGDQVTLQGAHKIPFGLCVGSADLIGIAPDGRFLAVEVKMPASGSRRAGRVSPEQRDFLAAVNAAGGLGGIARSVEDAMELISGARQGGPNNT